MFSNLKNNLEIERKFLVTKKIPRLRNGIKILQAYIFLSDQKEFRVRIVENKCKIGIKFNLEGIFREELEYEIPITEGLRIIELGSIYPPITKIRYEINFKNMAWEIDFFLEQNEGLILAEIELNSLEQQFILPPWVSEEVTYDKKYYNMNLYKNPYINWRHNV